MEGIYEVNEDIDRRGAEEQAEGGVGVLIHFLEIGGQLQVLSQVQGGCLVVLHMVEVIAVLMVEVMFVPPHLQGHCNEEDTLQIAEQVIHPSDREEGVVADVMEDDEHS